MAKKQPSKSFGPGHDGKWYVLKQGSSKPRIVKAKTAAEAAREAGLLITECEQIRPYYEEGTKEPEVVKPKSKSRESL